MRRLLFAAELRPDDVPGGFGRTDSLRTSGGWTTNTRPEVSITSWAPEAGETNLRI